MNDRQTTDKHELIWQAWMGTNCPACSTSAQWKQIEASTYDQTIYRCANSDCELKLYDDTLFYKDGQYWLTLVYKAHEVQFKFVNSTYKPTGGCVFDYELNKTNYPYNLIGEACYMPTTMLAALIDPVATIEMINKSLAMNYLYKVVLLSR